MNQKKHFGFSTLELLITFVIVCLLAALVVTKYSEVRQNNRDEERKADINALQDAVETYRAANGNYPSLNQINTPSFRKAELKSLDNNSLQDPRWNKGNKACAKGGLAILEGSTKPSAGCYGYALSPANCNNQAIVCTSYTLTAELENNQIYIKKSND